MKIIFLDFDGVLCTERNMSRLQRFGQPCSNPYGIHFDPDCVDNLRQLIDRTQAAVVIISSWKTLGHEVMRQLWEEQKMPGRLIGCTPSNVAGPDIALDSDGCLPSHFNPFSMTTKGNEIEAWISQNGEPEAYLIIDDNPDFTPAQQAHYLRTDPYMGLSAIDVERGCSILSI